MYGANSPYTDKAGIYIWTSRQMWTARNALWSSESSAPISRFIQVGDRLRGAVVFSHAQPDILFDGHLERGAAQRGS